MNNASHQVILKLDDDAESASREAEEYADLMRSIGQGEFSCHLYLFGFPDTSKYL